LLPWKILPVLPGYRVELREQFVFYFIAPTTLMKPRKIMNVFRYLRAAVQCGLLVWLCAGSISAASGDPRVLGWLEGAYLQPWGVRVRAKLDTGALTSSMHAENIELFEKDNVQWVRFHFPFGKREGYENGFEIERPLVREANIKEHVGTSVPRYVIEIDICVSGETRPVEVSLVDRSNFNYPMILGRNALAGRIHVDAGRSFIGDRTCPRKLK